jgi:hypothetical protein
LVGNTEPLLPLDFVRYGDIPLFPVMREQAVVESVGDVLGLIDMFEGSPYIQKGFQGLPPSIFGSTAYNCLHHFSSHPIVAVSWLLVPSQKVEVSGRLPITLDYLKILQQVNLRY